MDSHFVIFFLDDFHRGAVNHIVHFVGFTVLGYGLGKWSWRILAISPLIMELGHLVNYLSGTHEEFAIKIIPLQLIAWIVFVAIGYFVAGKFGNQKGARS